LERRLTILDEKIHALLTSHAPEELMLKIRREVDGQLAMYRRKMRAEQLAMVENSTCRNGCWKVWNTAPESFLLIVAWARKLSRHPETRSSGLSPNLQGRLFLKQDKYYG